MTHDQNNDIFLTIIADLSGSMYAADIVDESLAGLNNLVTEQAALPGQGWASIYTFDGKVVPRYEAWGLADLPPLTQDSVEGHKGMTALYDAVGFAVSQTDDWCRANPWFQGKHLVAIFTDGQENASQEWTAARVRELKVTKEAQGWGFVFMGAGIDAWEVGRHIGMAKGQTVHYNRTAAGATSNSIHLNTSLSAYRGAPAGQAFQWVDTPDQPDEDQTEGTTP